MSVLGAILLLLWLLPAIVFVAVLIGSIVMRRLRLHEKRPVAKPHARAN